MVPWKVRFTLKPDGMFQGQQNVGPIVPSREVSIDDAKLAVSGDSLIVSFLWPAADNEAAEAKAMNLADRFCGALAVVTAEPVSWEINGYSRLVDGTELSGASAVTRWNGLNYDLKRLPKDIDAAGLVTSLNDQVIKVSCDYFLHAALLLDDGMRNVDPRSPSAQLLYADILLNFYKSATTILGDKKVEKSDAVKKRYTALKIAEIPFLVSDIKELARLRNQSGVAHHSLDPAVEKKARNGVDQAKQTARKVLWRYVGYRRDGGAAFKKLD